MNTNLKMLAALAAITLTSPVATLYATVGGQEVSQAVMTIRGNVKDVNGEPLIGVSISVKGRSGQGTVTDIDGNFTLQCEKGNVLSFSYIGYKTTEVKVGNKSDLMITLQEDTEQLEEVIVVGYGTTTRKSAVGSVSQVKSEAITKRPVANVTQALQGAAPGVIVQQTSYNPNDNKTNFNIRGISTLNDNSPLIVIDGIVSDGGSFNKLNPNDIENISVLKDAGTAAIYGSRSANGVIVVTTKSGKRMKTNSTFKWFCGLAKS